MKYSSGFLIFSALLSSVANAQSQCPFDASTLWGGRVYVLDGNGRPTPFEDITSLEGARRTRTRLFYIVKSDTPRSGVLAIKSARYGSARGDDEPRDGLVRLQRNETNECKGDVRPPFVGQVSKRAYAQYHDLGRDDGEYLRAPAGGQTSRQAIEKFHTVYPDTNGGCRASNARLRADGSWERRSNRSQFSFRVDVVDNGYDEAVYTLVANAAAAVSNWLTPAAIANARQMREQTVEIKSYQVVGGVACIPFSVQVRGPLQVLRVNDVAERRVNRTRNEFRRGPD
ncbi:MAG: hypothetical protein KF904_20650 [Rhodoblastus sp.]|nr:hypothetical protein [Rhodoblastus sp.]